MLIHSVPTNDPAMIYAPGTVLDAGNPALNKTDKIPTPTKLTSSREYRFFLLAPFIEIKYTKYKIYHFTHI